MTQHVYEVRGDDNQIKHWECSECGQGKKFSTKSEADSHYQREHPAGFDNAGSVTHAGGPKENPVAFTHCKTCGEGISGPSAKGHENHDVEVVHKNRENSNGAWPLSMKCSFIEPGVVNYADVGMVLVRKEVLDKMMNSFIGKPIVNEDHRDVSPEDFEKGTAQGIVNSVWFEEKDAMYHAGYQVWDQPTLKNIRNGFKVSCAYKVTRWGPGGIHNNVPYEREVLDGEYTHLAIVANPRYEGVRIYNAKGANKMTFKWIQKLLGKEGQTMENSIDIESSKSILEVGGKEYTLDNAIEALKVIEEQERKKLENKGPADDDVIDVPGVGKRTVKQLKEAIALKNAKDEEDEKDTEDKKRKKADEEEKARDNKLKNDMAMDHKDGKHKDKELESCGMCNDLQSKRGREHFQRVDALANSRDGDLVNELPEHIDGFAEGRKRFGSEPATAAK